MYYENMDVIYIKKAIKEGRLPGYEGTIWITKGLGKQSDDKHYIKAHKAVFATGAALRNAYTNGGSFQRAKDSWRDANTYYKTYKAEAKKRAIEKLGKAKPAPRTAGAVKLESFAKKKKAAKKPAAKPKRRS